MRASPSLLYCIYTIYIVYSYKNLSYRSLQSIMTSGGQSMESLYTYIRDMQSPAAQPRRIYTIYVWRLTHTYIWRVCHIFQWYDANGRSFDNILCSYTFN